MSVAEQQKSSAFRVVDLVSDDNDKRFEPAGRMAAAIIDIIQAQGGCLPQDLNAKGFTPDDVALHWHMANALAGIELRLMGADHAHIKSIFERKR